MKNDTTKKAPNDEADTQRQQQTPQAGNQLEGEGSYTAARHYREGVEQTVEGGQVEQAAHEAAEALDGPEGDALREAERAAKQGHKQTSPQKS